MSCTRAVHAADSSVVTLSRKADYVRLNVVHIFNYNFTYNTLLTQFVLLLRHQAGLRCNSLENFS